MVFVEELERGGAGDQELLDRPGPAFEEEVPDRDDQRRGVCAFAFPERPPEGGQSLPPIRFTQQVAEGGAVLGAPTKEDGVEDQGVDRPILR